MRCRRGRLDARPGEAYPLRKVRTSELVARHPVPPVSLRRQTPDRDQGLIIGRRRVFAEARDFVADALDALLGVAGAAVDQDPVEALDAEELARAGALNRRRGLGDAIRVEQQQV